MYAESSGDPRLDLSRLQPENLVSITVNIAALVAKQKRRTLRQTWGDFTDQTQHR
jgi:hypothetical protein